MANVLALGKLPGCYRLRTRAIHCDLYGGHYHVLEGGAQLTHNLDLKGSNPVIPYECKSRLVQQIMPQSLDVVQKVGLMAWNYTKCSSKGSSAVLHPEVEWCKHCGHQKLSSAETTLGNIIQAILNTWEIGNLVVTTIKVD